MAHSVIIAFRELIELVEAIRHFKQPNHGERNRVILWGFQNISRLNEENENIPNPQKRKKPIEPTGQASVLFEQKRPKGFHPNQENIRKQLKVSLQTTNSQKKRKHFFGCQAVSFSSQKRQNPNQIKTDYQTRSDVPHKQNEAKLSTSKQEALLFQEIPPQCEFAQGQEQQGSD